jgi:hypothetical protein
MGNTIEVITYIDVFVYCRCATLKNYGQLLDTLTVIATGMYST